MRLTSRHFSQLLLTPQEPIKLITFLLGTRILPIGTKRMRKGIGKLLLQPALRVQSIQQLLRILTPVNTAMLLTCAADSTHKAEIKALLLQPVQHAVQCLQPERDGREHLVLGLVGQHALFYGEAVRVGVEVEDGYIDNPEVGVDDQTL